MKYHLCMSVRGALRKPKKQLKGIMFDDNGRPMSADEVIETLMDELSKGHEVLPIGECDNFDYIHGCKGHPDEVDTK